MLAWIKRNKYLLGFLIAVIAIGYFGYGYYKSSTEVKETVRTATVEYGHLSDSISATGSLSAVDNVDISSKITTIYLNHFKRMLCLHLHLINLSLCHNR